MNNTAKYIIILFFLFSSVNLLAKSTFSADRIEEACISYVYNIVGDDAEVQLLNKLNDMSFDEDGIKAQFTGEKENLIGMTYVGLEFTKDNRLIKRIKIPVKVKIYMMLPVLTRSMAGGEEIALEDITYRKLEVSKYDINDIPAKEDIISSSLKRSMRKGAVLLKSQLRRAGLIQKGDKVTLIVQRGGVRIRTSGYSLQDGAYEDEIKIKRNGSILHGSVAMDGTVLISSGRSVNYNKTD